jgi:hypothetical protein
MNNLGAKGTTLRRLILPDLMSGGKVNLTAFRDINTSEMVGKF